MSLDIITRFEESGGARKADTLASLTLNSDIVLLSTWDGS